MLNSFSVSLTLTELEATTSLGLSGLLTLNNAAVACEETVILQVLLVFGVHLDECAGDSKTQSLALACEAASVEVDLDVVFLFNTQQGEPCSSPPGSSCGGSGSTARRSARWPPRS